ncbi:MAG: hypothetical protein H3C30_18725 [Candidatus Hydrogenedentes bacterium]|nr:hypothetical protein [Candidatus Hydrogenedentota bacterium]
MSKQEVIIEYTSRVGSFLEKGGLCGQRIAYDADVIREIMGAGCDVNTVTGDSRVPGLKEVTLHQYIYYHGVKGRVIDAGTVIQ